MVGGFRLFLFHNHELLTDNVFEVVIGVHRCFNTRDFGQASIFRVVKHFRLLWLFSECFNQFLYFHSLILVGYSL